MATRSKEELPTDFSKVDFLVSNEANFEVLSKAKKENSGICNILITTLPIKEYAEELKHQEEATSRSHHFDQPSKQLGC